MGKAPLRMFAATKLAFRRVQLSRWRTVITVGVLRRLLSGVRIIVVVEGIHGSKYGTGNQLMAKLRCLVGHMLIRR